jgi:hypothetical protein
MGSSPGTRDHRTLIAAASFVLGPLLMSIGDLLHPKESLDTAAQIAIIVQQASRWYAAHLLLFVGILLLIPGLVALPTIAAERSQTAAHAARLLLLIGVAAFAAIFVGEMLIGRFVTNGASRDAASALLDTMLSGPMAAAVGPGALAFFVGIGTLAVPLVRADGARRWTASLLSVGALLIFAEIVAAQVLLSQIGNVLMLAGGTVAARLLLQGASAPRDVA